MAGILSGLKSLGLDIFEGLEIYEKEDKSKTKQQSNTKNQLEEKDLIYNKELDCPICDKKFYTKVVRNNKARLLSTDLDLRNKFEGIDTNKYEIVTCTGCGYSAMKRHFAHVGDKQRELIQSNIQGKVKMEEPGSEIYSYEEALKRYKLALVCAVVKHGKNSEKAYICLKTAWLLRGYAEELDSKKELSEERRKELKAQEVEYLQNALDGFLTASSIEAYPICEMSELTMNYLLATLAYQVDQDEIALKKIADILLSKAANERVKNKARDLKQLIMDKRKLEKSQK